MKYLIIAILLAISFSVHSQDDKTVTLTVSAQGKTQDQAKTNALRNAIEQAFGTFISTNTEILNDELVKDEIVSVSNGNIQDYEVVSEIELPDGRYATTLKALVSVTKLTSFVESKGINVEFKGSLFAFNINQQILNEKNEVKAIEDVCKVIRNIADVSFDFTITTSDPISIDASNSKWRIPLYVSVYKNSNFNNIPKILYSTLKGISLTLKEAENYIQLGKIVYPISIASSENEYSYILLRNKESIFQLLKMMYYFNHSLLNFNISNGIAEWSLKDKPENIKYIYDYGFRLFIKKINNGSYSFAFCKASVFYKGRSNWGGDYKKGLTEECRDCRLYQGNIVLDYKDWYGNKKDLLNITTIDEFQTKLETIYWFNGTRIPEWNTGERYFTNQFSFVNNLKNKMLNNESGLVISFIPHYYEKNYRKMKKNEDKELIRFYYEDIRNISEINKISEYKVLPINN